MKTWVKNALKVYWKLGLLITAIVYMVTTTALLVATRHEVSDVRAQCRIEITTIMEETAERRIDQLKKDRDESIKELDDLLNLHQYKESKQ